MINWRTTLTIILTSLLLLTGCGREAKHGDIVTVHFTGKLADGKIFETTQGGEPRKVHIGANLILPAFEQALIGMKEGDKKSLRVKPEQAFGPRNEGQEMIQVIEKASLPHALDYRVGERFSASITYPDGSKGTHAVVVTAVDDKTVTVDANHPLAGKDLNFEIELIAIN